MEKKQKQSEKENHSANLQRLMLFLFVGIFLVSLASATVNTLGEVRQDDCILLTQTCASCSYVNVSVTLNKENTTLLDNVAMSQSGSLWTYSFCNTSELGRYDVQGQGDLEGTATGFNVLYFEVKNTNLIYLIIILSLATLFFIATLFVNEEFFVYISGVLFLIAGIYIMINGIDLVYDWYSRGIAYILIGLGFLFTIGAYIYNSYNKWRDEEY